MSEKQCAGAVLGLANQIRRKFNMITDKNATQTHILYFLFHDGACRKIYQKDIEEALNIKSASLSVQLKKMEKSNMIARRKVSGDDRLKEVCPAPAGIALKEQINDEINLLEDILTEGICKKDLDTFYDVVRKMSENISSNEKNYVHRGGGKQ
ncbi:transcriptional regulator, MarR family [Marvinbryantia formatexigens DSM 14469]|uniref:Transcriptional regulator, MarR family n=1 Tax=Marvinbryantia formatexigens DSM 14469 TaxID=478749 RepID=C6L8X2_9FIRM|nr:MarR family transcriptional regulator [Marvinbryantia formatexigens]EET62711.1 transcriptional regulator, MarR family [Marvinbryantia formatexigens DSM 14469]UWO23081.1 MarR family transcriptional regulator [Marvinbryantia formatexigens DSM 14469]SDF98477.1 DNA-binding transcriptional regulator, MarR family [Marvinbryantia formatexigens]